MAKAVTLKNSNNETVYPVTDAVLVNGTISSAQIASNSVTAAKMSDSVLTYEKYFEYIQANDVSDGSIVQVYVPIDLENYSQYKIEMFGEARSSDAIWTSAGAKNSSYETINCDQRGIEIPSGGGSVSCIYRTSGEIIAWGALSGESMECSIEIKRGNTINYPQFRATGNGAGRGQWLQGRINTNPIYVKYIYVPLKSPNAGNWVRAYRLK